MVLKDSAKTAKTIQSSSQANAAAVYSSQSNSLRHAPLNTSVKIAGVILFVVLASLIVVSAQASGKQANTEFNEANKDAVGASIQIDSATKAAANDDDTTSDTAQPAGSSVSANVTNGAVEVTINGESMDVPARSNYSKTTTNEDGTTSVNISNNTSSTGSANNGFSYSSTVMSSNSFSSTNGGNTSNVYMYTSP